MRPRPVGADPGGCKHDSGGVRAGRARGRHGYCVRPPPGLRRLKTALTGKGGSRALFRRSSVLGAAGIGEFTGDSMRRSAVERQLEVFGDALDRVRCADSETSRRIPDLARVMGLWADLLSLKEPDPTIRLFAPAQVDFGRRMRIASKVFIDRNFTAMSIGGITIGEGVVVGPRRARRYAPSSRACRRAGDWRCPGAGVSVRHWESAPVSGRLTP